MVRGGGGFRGGAQSSLIKDIISSRWKGTRDRDAKSS